MGESEHDGSKSHDRKQRAYPIDVPCSGGVAALVHVAHRKQHDDNGERHVDEERGAPADVLDQPTADYRADCGRNSTEARPGPDGAAALRAIKRGADDRQTAGDEERGTDSLQSAPKYQKPRRRRQAAPYRRGRKPNDAHQKYSLASELVAERATDQNQCAQEKSVG